MQGNVFREIILITAFFFSIAASYAESLYAEKDYLDPELRANVEALKLEVQTTPTTLNNVAERTQIVWKWCNALSLQGVHIPVETPRIIAQAVQLELNPQPAILVLPFITNVVREFQIKEEQPDAIGEVTISTNGPFQVDEFVTFEQTYTVGEMPMREGGGVLVGWELVARLAPFQRDDPNAPNYISIRSSNPAAEFEPTGIRLLGMHGNIFAAANMPVYKLKGTTLQSGDTITVSYGGSPGMQMQTTEVDECLFPLYVDLEGTGNFLSPRWPSLRIVGGAAARVSVIGPSIVGVDEPITLSIRTEDKYYNRANTNVPQYEISIQGPSNVELDSIAQDNALIAQGGVTLDTPGVHRFTVRSADGAIEGTSNPILVVDAPTQRIYWGDTHAHTNLAEAQGGVENFYRYARDDARLDFVVLSEHDLWMQDDEWELLRTNAISHNEEGRFLAFLGYEWTAQTVYGGHHNVLFRTPEGRDRVPVQETDGLWALFDGLQAANEVADVVVIPHAHIPGDWRIADPKTERLVEIMSMHGNFEWFGNAYLANGHQIGFIAASDDHSGRPGYSGPFAAGPLQQFGGLGAVYAPALETDALFDAMRNRTTYATMGQRTILQATLNGRPMGERIPFNAKRTIEASVYGTAPIESIAVIKNGKSLHEEHYLRAGFAADGWIKVAFESPSEDLIRDVPRGHRKWDGTLRISGATIEQVQWLGVDQSYHEVVERDDADSNLIRIKLTTRGSDNAFLVKLAGASDTTAFEFSVGPAFEEGITFPRMYQPSRFPPSTFTIPLEGMDESGRGHDLPLGRYTDRVSIQPINPEGPLDREFAFVDELDAYDGDYYYLRIRQLDGRYAWSSPWWVGGVSAR